MKGSVTVRGSHFSCEKDLKTMHDEDTGDAIICPTCGSEGECPHLLAVLDRSFQTCVGGYALDRFQKFEDMIRKAFTERIRAGSDPGPSWAHRELDEMWKYAVDQTSDSEEMDAEIDIDGDPLFRLVAALLDREGVVELYAIEGDDMPGFTSAMSVLYADDAENAFETALADLHKSLSD
jgi:hypothetical protein